MKGRNRTVVKTLPTARAAVAYAATCERRLPSSKRSSISFVPVQEGDKFTVVKVEAWA